jgi:hypothetical protein
VHKLLPFLKLEVGEQLAFKPTSLKHNLYPERMIVTYTGGVLCPVRRLHDNLADAAATGQPIQQYLCRPLSADRATFLEQPLTVAAFEEDESAHFEAAGVEYHATLHGSRRDPFRKALHKARLWQR